MLRRARRCRCARRPSARRSTTAARASSSTPTGPRTTRRDDRVAKLERAVRPDVGPRPRRRQGVASGSSTTSSSASRRTRSAATCPRTRTSTSSRSYREDGLPGRPRDAAAAPPSLAVVVPVYNEAATDRDRACARSSTSHGDYAGPLHGDRRRRRQRRRQRGDPAAACSASSTAARGRAATSATRATARRCAAVRARARRERARLRGVHRLGPHEPAGGPPADRRSWRPAGHPYIKASRFVAGGSMAAVPLAPAGGLERRQRRRRGAVRRRDPRRDQRLPRRAPGPARALAAARDATSRASSRSSTGRCATASRPVEFPTVLGARTADQRVSAFPYSAGLIRKYLTYALRGRLRAA